jgi:uncharacterized protein YcbK (DUF882 family)
MTDFHHQKAADADAYNLRATPRSTRVSADFLLGEFACNDGSEALLLHPRLVELCQRIRDTFGPVSVTSGYRSGSWNERIGGAPRSKHLLGCAADLDAHQATPTEVADFAAGLDVGGLGRYNTFTHVDVIGQGRRWDRR